MQIWIHLRRFLGRVDTFSPLLRNTSWKHPIGWPELILSVNWSTSFPRGGACSEKDVLIGWDKRFKWPIENRTTVVLSGLFVHPFVWLSVYACVQDFVTACKPILSVSLSVCLCCLFSNLIGLSVPVHNGQFPVLSNNQFTANFNVLWKILYFFSNTIHCTDGYLRSNRTLRSGKGLLKENKPHWDLFVFARVPRAPRKASCVLLSVRPFLCSTSVFLFL